LKSRLNDLKKLLETFEANLAQYKSSIYDEAKTRVDYIDKFFELLDWDVRNIKGYSEDYREVVREDRVVIQGKPKAPDYSFRIGKERKFFVEAKKPAVDIKQDRDPAFQLRRYAYTAKLPLSILTDFEEFAVYDTRIKPDHKDEADKARIFYTTYKEYPHYFDFIYSTFSREAILKGSFDRYVTESKGKRGTSEVDKEFLKLIETWRNDLARNIALRNKDLTLNSLNHAVQKIIDRIIFLRIAEDRQMEVYGLLAEAAKGQLVYEVIDALFQRSDQKYNSGLFRKQDWISKLVIDDKIMKSIVQGLYYPQCPYELSVMPIEILGNIYEQFLGKTIRLTTGHQAKVEEKPEVRKAGGVYYTPQYIVDYIVKNTVGEKVKGKTPKRISELRILDPACGSGSFLVGAYTFLLSAHLEYYTKPNNLTKHLKPGIIYQVAEKTYRLSTKEKQRILLNNIYGVDIDSQAVEVTKLSLLLKLMEDENIEAEGDLFKHSDFKLLPDLSNNIKCGNSLIGSDFYDGKNLALFDNDQMRKINAFDWDKEFPDIFAKGGFDCVIGNPPYGAFFDPMQKEYIKNKYRSFKYRFDSYIYFMEKSINLSNNNGMISFITPELWLKLENGVFLRKYIAAKTGFKSIYLCGENVFEDAIVNTIIFVFNKGIKFESLIIKSEFDEWKILTNDWQSNQLYNIDYRLRPRIKALIEKVKEQSSELSKFGNAIQGITPYDKYSGQKEEIIKNRAFHFKTKKESTCHKWLAGRDIERYFQSWSGEWLSYGDWLAAPRDMKFFKDDRLLFREVPGKNKRIQATLVTDEVLLHGHSITPFKIFENNLYSPKYLLAISNSKLISWYSNLILPNFGKNIFPKLNPQDIKQLPIKDINFSNNNELNKYKRIEQLVDQILKTQTALHNAKDETDKKIYQKRANLLDRQIDNLVYKLYGLTDEEIRIVEEGV